MNIITDNQSELFDLVNENDEVIGKITRRQAHSDPKLIHRAVGVLIFNSKGELFLQKRSSTKDMDPGKWTISTTGHLTSGQDWDEGARRELEEELGIHTELSFVAKWIVSDEQETEVNTLYKGIHDGPFILHPEEIEVGDFFAITEIEKKYKKGELPFSIGTQLSLYKGLNLFAFDEALKKYIIKTFH